MSDVDDAFHARCTQIYEQGKKKYGDRFDVAINMLARTGGVDAATLQKVVIREDAADLLYQAGRHHPQMPDDEWSRLRAEERAERRKGK
jgi:hypothetical protein